MRVLATPLVERSRMLSDEDGWIWLYELEVPTDPPTRYRLAGHRTAVSFGTTSSGEPLVYAPAPILHGPLEQNSDGEAAKVQLQVGNADRVLMQDLEDYDGLADVAVKILVVHRDHLGDPNAKGLEFRGVVLGTRATPERVAFDVGVQDLFAFKLPAQRFTKFYCRHLEQGYGSALCGAPIDDAGFFADFPTCGGTLADCRARGAGELAHGLPVLHPLRYGGFPGIPRPSAR